MDELERKIGDVQFAITELETVLNTIKDYDQYSKEYNDLEKYKSFFEGELEALEIEQEELEEQEIEESRNEINELERQYWREAI